MRSSERSKFSTLPPHPYPSPPKRGGQKGAAYAAISLASRLHTRQNHCVNLSHMPYGPPPTAARSPVYRRTPDQRRRGRHSWRPSLDSPPTSHITYNGPVGAAHRAARPSVFCTRPDKRFAAYAAHEIIRRKILRRIPFSGTVRLFSPKYQPTHRGRCGQRPLRRNFGFSRLPETIAYRRPGRQERRPLRRRIGGRPIFIA